MKKLIVAALVAVMSAGMVNAAPHGGRGGHHRVHHAHPVHHIHHHNGWGRGGSHFWPGFFGGLVGGIVYDSIVTTPIVTTPVVTTPVIISQTVTPVTKVEQVWVEGKYVKQIDANGKEVQVWQPGHYEQRTVIVQ